jgi:2-keto-3-deoxy-L-fuconate dehydrogenase
MTNFLSIHSPGNELSNGAASSALFTGIGRCTAISFAKEGATVYATDINAEELAKLDGIPG